MLLRLVTSSGARETTIISLEMACQTATATQTSRQSYWQMILIKTQDYDEPRHEQLTCFPRRTILSDGELVNTIAGNEN